MDNANGDKEITSLLVNKYETDSLQQHTYG